MVQVGLARYTICLWLIYITNAILKWTFLVFINLYNEAVRQGREDTSWNAISALLKPWDSIFQNGFLTLNYHIKTYKKLFLAWFVRVWGCNQDRGFNRADMVDSSSFHNRCCLSQHRWYIVMTYDVILCRKFLKNAF